MKDDDVSKIYGIPKSILNEYAKYVFSDNSTEYTSQDIKNMGLIMTLHEIGFSDEKIEIYMRCLLFDKEKSMKNRLFILQEKREQILDDIHIKQKQLDCLDYLRYEIKRDMKEVKK